MKVGTVNHTTCKKQNTRNNSQPTDLLWYARVTVKLWYTLNKQESNSQINHTSDRLVIESTDWNIISECLTSSV